MNVLYGCTVALVMLQGVNAQFAVVSSQLSSFEASLREAVSLALGSTAAGDALDLNMGAMLPIGSPAPFKRCVVFKKNQCNTLKNEYVRQTQPAFFSHKNFSLISLMQGSVMFIYRYDYFFYFFCLHQCDYPVPHAFSHRFRVVNRPQILTDGLPPMIAEAQEEGTSDTEQLEWDWSGDVGVELEASQWHQELSEAKQKKEARGGSGEEESSFPVLLDCRNDYESDAGGFQGAKALNTATFRCAVVPLYHSHLPWLW